MRFINFKLRLINFTLGIIKNTKTINNNYNHKLINPILKFINSNLNLKKDRNLKFGKNQSQNNKKKFPHPLFE